MRAIMVQLTAGHASIDVDFFTLMLKFQSCLKILAEIDHEILIVIRSFSGGVARKKKQSQFLVDQK